METAPVGDSIQMHRPSGRRSISPPPIRNIDGGDFYRWPKAGTWTTALNKIRAAARKHGADPTARARQTTHYADLIFFHDAVVSSRTALHKAVSCRAAQSERPPKAHRSAGSTLGRRPVFPHDGQIRRHGAEPPPAAMRRGPKLHVRAVRLKRNLYGHQDAGVILGPAPGNGATSTVGRR